MSLLPEFEEQFGYKAEKPTDLELTFYFLNEQGLSLKDLDDLPLPYIFGLMRAKAYVDRKEMEARKKAMKRKH